jgi:MSHA biogenesis protein MshO
MALVMRANTLQSGFSMIELIVAHVATSLLFVALLPFFARPLRRWWSAIARARSRSTQSAAFARLGQELPTALPNSVRIACSGACLEFIPVVDQADYRALTPGDKLDFAAADDRFDVLMPLAAAPATGLEIVINNQSSASAGSSSAYSADSISDRGTIVAGTTASQIRFTSKLFPAPSARQRFFVVGTPVSYLCAPAANGGTLRRYAGYATQTAQPTNTALGDLLASGIVDCRFTLNDSRLVTVRLVAGDGSIDSVPMLDEFRLVNLP